MASTYGRASKVITGAAAAAAAVEDDGTEVDMVVVHMTQNRPAHISTVLNN